jgi:DNA-binding transcriptional LysR family regulator
MEVAPADLLLFATVVRAGGFSEAARQLGVTKQSVSERIGRLEAALGVRLLERTTRSVRPTEAGARYHRHCEAIAARIAEANAEAREQQSEPVGLLRVTAPALYGRRLLAPIVTTFRRRHPQVRVEVLIADRRVDLVEEGFDLAIRAGDLPDSTLASRKLFDNRVGFVASPALLEGRAPPTVDTLPSWPVVGRRAQETWEIGGRAVRVAPEMVVNDLEVVCDLVLGGSGIARLPELVCGDALADGRLRSVFAPDDALSRPIHVVYPSRQYLPARVRLFIDALVAASPRPTSDPG